MNIDNINPAPWERHQWSGRLVSVDGCDASDFTRDDVASVLSWGTTGNRWDGETAGVVLLNDGRYAAWEADYGPTGHGFCHDAYGGEADIFFATTEEAARGALSERARELLA